MFVLPCAYFWLCVLVAYLSGFVRIDVRLDRAYDPLRVRVCSVHSIAGLRSCGLLPSDRWFHDNSSTDISSTTLRLQTVRLQTFRLLLHTSVQDSYTSNFCFSKSLFSSIPTPTYTMIPFYQFHSTDTMIIQHRPDNPACSF